MREGRTAALWSVALAALLATALTACGGSDEDGNSAHKVNGDIHVTAGKAMASVGSVNGSIQIDDNATFGDAGTVNGSVNVGAHATGGSIKTVNGAVHVGPGAHLSGSIKLVNGEVTLDDGSGLAQQLVNVNGGIKITNAHVGGGISTTNSSLTITGASHIEDGIHYEKPGMSTSNGNPPTVVIGPGVTVQGNLNFERPVRLFVSDHATIGPVTGATVVPFSGDAPPP